MPCSAFITAYNPLSQNLSDEVNVRSQDALASELSERSLTFIDGIGMHSSGNWPSESSYLVLGLSLEAAKVLGSKYNQNAIV